MTSLIGQVVMHRKTKERGVILDIKDNKIYVMQNGQQKIYLYPEALADTLILQNQDLQKKLEFASSDAGFERFIKSYKAAVRSEIDYLHLTGGKKYQIVDGEMISKDRESYVYRFDTDTDLHFPDSTAIKIKHADGDIFANVLSCEDFMIIFRTGRYLGEKIEKLEFTAEAWQLLESLIERLDEMDVTKNKIAYELACKGRSQINPLKPLVTGQDAALRKAVSSPLTFIWGPPGTGKTTTLAKIALELMGKGKRILMLSYSNVSVDGALLEVARRSDYASGTVVRYGYPRKKELLESDSLTSYAYVLQQHPDIAHQCQQLLEQKKGLRKKDPARIEIENKLTKVRKSLLDYEKELIQEALFVATTVSKAVIDKALYSQCFDYVIFDEASMAYIPQIVFAAGLAKEGFCCLGDFRQLPAIVQNPSDQLLTTDIFDHVGITDAVESGCGHQWLVMLNEQYRMHHEIADFAGRSMYGGNLFTAEKIRAERQKIATCIPLSEEPIGMVDLSETYSVCIKTMDGSRINLLSAMLCVKLAETNIVEYKYGVGIITPYSAQSRLILAMIRDIQERNCDFDNVSCATVHQFQGSEKPVIIYDAVDCYRMQYPGTLLTAVKNNMADRLFNVALTRAQGKFILVANRDFLFRKMISPKLMFTKLMREIEQQGNTISCSDVIGEIGTIKDEIPEMFLGACEEKDSWQRYKNDIRSAKSEVFIEVPGLMEDDPKAISELSGILREVHERGVEIYLRAAQNVTLPKELEKYAHEHPYATTPITIIDREIIWFGEPLSAAMFVSEGELIETKWFPCLRFVGKHTARMLKAFYEIPSIRGKAV